MSNQLTMPGDEQLAEVVSLWVLKNVTPEAVMVLRREHPVHRGIEYKLINVELITTSEPFFYIPGFGTFGSNGLLCPPGAGITRLLIPSVDLANWANGTRLWIPGNVRNNEDAPDANYEILKAKLEEQRQRQGVTEEGRGGVAAEGQGKAPRKWQSEAKKNAQ